jgi:hypothetical protein
MLIVLSRGLGIVVRTGDPESASAMIRPGWGERRSKEPLWR